MKLIQTSIWQTQLLSQTLNIIFFIKVTESARLNMKNLKFPTVRVTLECDEAEEWNSSCLDTRKNDGNFTWIILMTSKTWKIIHKINFLPYFLLLWISIRGKRDGLVFERFVRGKKFLLRCGKTENWEKMSFCSPDDVIVPQWEFFHQRTCVALVRHVWEYIPFQKSMFHIFITY